MPGVKVAALSLALALLAGALLVRHVDRELRRHATGVGEEPPHAEYGAGSAPHQSQNLGRLGHPRADLTPAELAAFAKGKRLFTVKPPTLGPLYNGETCGACHAIPTVGGSGDLAHATYLGPGTESEVTFYQTHALPDWTIPIRPAGVGPRIAPPLYGLGLIERISDDTIRSACGQGHPGRAKLRPGSLPTNYVARFGLKPILGTVVDFVGGELLFNHSATNPLEGTETSFSRDRDEFPDPEVDRAFAESLAAFVRGLEPPERNGTDAVGEVAFRSFGCATCHVPDLPPAMGVFSDFCAHRMGEAFADGIVDHGVQSDEFRTTPLWGLRFKNVYLHDGPTASLQGAILAHSGEAWSAASAYQNAPSEQRDALHRYLHSL